MNWIQEKRKSLEWSIKFTRRALISQLSVQVFNFAGIAWNVCWLMHDQTNIVSFGFGLGAFSSNSLWTLAFCAKYWGEIKDDKKELCFINELELREKLDEDRKFYQESRKKYEEFFMRWQEKANSQEVDKNSMGCETEREQPVFGQSNP